MCGAVKPLFALPFYFLRLLQGWKSLNQSKRAAASVDESHQLCDSPYIDILFFYKIATVLYKKGTFNKPG